MSSSSPPPRKSWRGPKTGILKVKGKSWPRRWHKRSISVNHSVLTLQGREILLLGTILQIPRNYKAGEGKGKKPKYKFLFQVTVPEGPEITYQFRANDQGHFEHWIDIFEQSGCAYAESLGNGKEVAATSGQSGVGLALIAAQDKTEQHPSWKHKEKGVLKIKVDSLFKRWREYPIAVDYASFQYGTTEVQILGAELSIGTSSKYEFYLEIKLDHDSPPIKCRANDKEHFEHWIYVLKLAGCLEHGSVDKVLERHTSGIEETGGGLAELQLASETSKLRKSISEEAPSTPASGGSGSEQRPAVTRSNSWQEKKQVHLSEDEVALRLKVRSFDDNFRIAVIKAIGKGAWRKHAFAKRLELLEAYAAKKGSASPPSTPFTPVSRSTRPKKAMSALGKKSGIGLNMTERDYSKANKSRTMAPKSARKPKKTPSRTTSRHSSNTTGRSLASRQSYFTKREDSEEEVPRPMAPLAHSPDRVVLNLASIVSNSPEPEQKKNVTKRKKKTLRANKRKQKAAWVRNTRVDPPSVRRSVKKHKPLFQSQRFTARKQRSKQISKARVPASRTITAASVNSWRTDAKTVELMRPGELRKFEVAERRAYQKAGLKEKANSSSYIPHTHTSLDSILRAHWTQSPSRGTKINQVSVVSPNHLSGTLDHEDQLNVAAQKEEKENEQRILKSMVHSVLPQHYGDSVLASRHAYVSSTLGRKGGCIMYAHPAEYTAPVQYSKPASMINHTHNVVEPMTPPHKRTHPLVDRYMSVVGRASETSPLRQSTAKLSGLIDESIGSITLGSEIISEDKHSPISQVRGGTNTESGIVAENEQKATGLKIEQLSPIGADDGAVVKLQLEIEALDAKLRKLKR